MIFNFRRKKSIALVLALILALGAATDAGASVIQNAQDKINQSKDKINESKKELGNINNQIGKIENEQSKLQNEIDALDTDLVALLLEIDVLKDEIEQKTLEIEDTTAKLEDAKAKEAEQYESMKLRIQFMYEQSDGMFIEALLGAKSMADLLNRTEYYNQIYEYDRNQLEEYKDTVAQVEELKATLEAEKEEMLDLEGNLEAQSDQLKKMIAEKESAVEDFQAKLSQAKILANKYKQTINEQNAAIAKQERIISAEKERQRQEELRRAAEEAARRAAENGGSDSGSSGGNSSNDGTEAGLDPAYSTNISGTEVVNYAAQFVGNPYVWGGTSLTNGADCSGFIMSVFKHFGITLPHSSYLLRSCGKNVSYSNAKPGDIVCYSGHVALYAGNGKIIGAQSSKVGIKYENATYKPIICVRRVL